jgi:hypothetical protein
MLLTLILVAPFTDFSNELAIVIASPKPAGWGGVREMAMDARGSIGSVGCFGTARLGNKSYQDLEAKMVLTAGSGERRGGGLRVRSLVRRARSADDDEDS